MSMWEESQPRIASIESHRPGVLFRPCWHVFFFLGGGLVYSIRASYGSITYDSEEERIHVSCEGSWKLIIKDMMNFDHLLMQA